MASMNPPGSYSPPSTYSPFAWGEATSGAVSWSLQPSGEYRTRADVVRQLLRGDLFREIDLSRGPEGARHVGGVHNVLGR